MSIPLSTTTNSTNSQLFFNVKVMDNLNGLFLKTLRPDINGYYTVPVTVLGEKSRNGPFYDVESIKKEITDTSTVFNQQLTQGNLYGEWGHPDRNADIERIDTILEDRWSHHIFQVFTGTEKLPSGGTVLYTKIKPSGPFGDLLEKSLLSQKENTAFSLRSLITARWDKAMNCQYRTVVRLVTFDFVGMPGYLQASKWYAPGTENYKTNDEILINITPDMLFDGDGRRIGLESFSDTELSNIFGLNEVQLHELKCGMHIKGTSTYFDNTGEKRSLMHTLLKNI